MLISSYCDKFTFMVLYIHIYIYSIYTKLAFNGRFGWGEQKDWEVVLQLGGPELKCWRKLASQREDQILLHLRFSASLSHDRSMSPQLRVPKLRFTT